MKWKRLIFFICLWVAGFDGYADSVRTLDSLFAILPHQKDTTKVNTLNQICWTLRASDPEKGIRFGLEAVTLAEKLKFNKGLLTALNFLGVCYRNFGNSAQAMTYYFRALEAAEKTKDIEQVGFTLNNLGFMYWYQGNLLTATSYVLRALKIGESIQNKTLIAYCQINLGRIYTDQKDYENAYKAYKKVYSIRQTEKDIRGAAIALYEIGKLQFLQKKYDSAIQYTQEAFSIMQRLRDISGMAMCHALLGDVYLQTKNFEQAEENLSKAIEIYEKSNEKTHFAAIFRSIAHSHFQKGDYEKAIDWAYKSYNVAKELSSKEDIKNSSMLLSEIYAKKRDFTTSYGFLKIVLEQKDSIVNEESVRKMKALETSYEVEKHRIQIESLQKEKRADDLVKIFMGVIIFLTAMAGIVILRAYRNNKNAKLMLEFQNKEISYQKQLIETKNERITQSIDYAKRIQAAMLPQVAELQDFCEDVFIMLRPKDEVSGDFYWFHQKGDKIIVAVADCTGHGIPGAFMSMVGNALLNDIVVERGITSPELILNDLHKGVRYALRQETTSSRDGMDIAVCTWDKQRSELLYAGAMNPIFYINKGSFGEIKADKKPIGGHQFQQVHFFTLHRIPIQKPFSLYMCSDGFQDQFGGEHNKKFLTKRFKQMLIDHAHLPLQEQKGSYQRIFEDWKGRYEQIDDVLLMGIRIV